MQVGGRRAERGGWKAGWKDGNHVHAVCVLKQHAIMQCVRSIYIQLIFSNNSLEIAKIRE